MKVNVSINEKTMEFIKDGLLHMKGIEVSIEDVEKAALSVRQEAVNHFADLVIKKLTEGN